MARRSRQIHSPISDGMKALHNSLIIKSFKYLTLCVAYHQIIKPLIGYLVAQISFGNIHSWENSFHRNCFHRLVLTQWDVVGQQYEGYAMVGQSSRPGLGQQGQTSASHDHSRRENRGGQGAARQPAGMATARPRHVVDPPWWPGPWRTPSEIRISNFWQNWLLDTEQRSLCQ